MKHGKLQRLVYGGLDLAFVGLDKQRILRTRNLRLVPTVRWRRVPGRPSYGEWCHVIGIFQTLLAHHVPRPADNRVLDVGCGTGILAVASEPFVGGTGRYIGIDVKRDDIEFCCSHYPARGFEFIHLPAHNAKYAPLQTDMQPRWPVDSCSIDVVTALSVWTHLNERDAVFYFREIDRVLRPGGRAIVTVYLLDEFYYHGARNRTDQTGTYNNTEESRYLLDKPSTPSGNWLHPAWAQQPEDTIGITPDGVAHMLNATTLVIRSQHCGNWKGVPGVFFQDVLIFEKPTATHASE